ncbi:hypothetical protein RR46_13576 [Papilio xuthus]|uniref:Uncharacterized protein n=1 Tax=Papilio xuthus TaxID=66420 RepID=A0A194PML3_PAPXU|nr:hypothetical protein RR46_13576 [Papilio xuthus]
MYAGHPPTPVTAPFSTSSTARCAPFHLRLRTLRASPPAAPVTSRISNCRPGSCGFSIASLPVEVTIHLLSVLQRSIGFRLLTASQPSASGYVGFLRPPAPRPALDSTEFP